MHIAVFNRWLELFRLEWHDSRLHISGQRLSTRQHASKFVEECFQPLQQQKITRLDSLLSKKKKTQSKQIRGGDTNTSTCNNNPGSGKRYKLRAQAFSFFKRAHSLLIYPLE